MKTNNFFDLDRFIGLLKQDVLFNYRFYLAFVAGLSLGIYCISYLMIRNLSGGFLSVYYILYLLLFCSILVFVGMSFPSFRNQIKTSYYLLMPGSAFEKMMVQIFVRFFLFIPLALVLLKFGVFLAIVSMMPDPQTGFDPLFVDYLSYDKIFGWDGFLYHNTVYYIPLLFYAFAGAVYFKRYAVVKTIGFMVLFPGSLLLGIKLSGGIINWSKMGTDFLNGGIIFYSFYPTGISLLLLSLPWAYFKLKEKEL